jgi:predicted transcriptional regulator
MDAIPEFRRDVLVSVRPIYATKILQGQKTVELRRKFPEVRATGALAVIYSSRPVSAVVGCARIKHVLKLPVPRIWTEYGSAACISKSAFDSYFAGLKFGFAVLLDSVKPLDRQPSLVELENKFGVVPPQSYRYLSKECVAFMSDGQIQLPLRHERRDRARRSPARGGLSR